MPCKQPPLVTCGNSACQLGCRCRLQCQMTHLHLRHDHLPLLPSINQVQLAVGCGKCHRVCIVRAMCRIEVTRSSSGALELLFNAVSEYAGLKLVTSILLQAAVLSAVLELLNFRKSRSRRAAIMVCHVRKTRSGRVSVPHPLLMLSSCACK